MRKVFRVTAKILMAAAIVFVLLGVCFYFAVRIPLPEVSEAIRPESFQREKVSDDFYRLGNSWLSKNKHGIWEMYLEGDAFERGVVYGKLAKELIEKQEDHFVRQIDEIVPNSMYQFFLKMFIAWFNRDLHKYIPEEFQREIYGVSLSFSDRFDHIGPKYYRILNYHAAHDIGHALKDLSLVGCTSFAVNKELSQDSALLIARNFDFYMGEGFAEDKLLVFVNPVEGFKYVSYSWAGFMGVVSGMNENGLTITINAAKSGLPKSAKCPISILAREILQYAENIDQAIAIAEKRATFVSESLLIGSAWDDKAVIIEKSTEDIAVFDTGKNLVSCTNHYQSEHFSTDLSNVENIEMSDSKYRFDRLKQLLESEVPLDPAGAVEILRNKEGLDGKNLGFGNPKAINQLIAHHGIVFKPAQRKLWVSASPYQLGTFVCYDLENAFQNKNGGFSIDSLNIGEDRFLYSRDFDNYQKYKTIKEQISKFVLLDVPFQLDENLAREFINLNPELYITYMLLGDYYFKINEPEKAKAYYTQSLQYEIASLEEERKILDRINSCQP
jgi:isopenicillin-N N-acyltransferase like protein